jgi:hemolysin activation/secretion protein
MFWRSRALLLLLLLGCLKVCSASILAADSSPTINALAPLDSGVPHFNVLEYAVEGIELPATNNLTPMYSKYVGTNVSLAQIVQAAADLQAEYRSVGYPLVSVAIAEKRITNGIVPMYVFQGAIQQILVSGRRYVVSSNGVELAMTSLPAQSAPDVVTNTAPPPFIYHVKSGPATPEELARARANLLQTMADLTAKENDTRVHVVSTNGGARFEVDRYVVEGNSILSPDIVAGAMTNVDGAFGTNVGIQGPITAATELQKAYRERGYVLVSVGLPQQKLTNGTVKVEVTEGRLANIKVTGNHYFSSNNIMRAFPSLHPNTMLNGPVFQAELNRANANQDRQVIHPVLSPGLEPGTSDLELQVKDQLPLHAKVELNNQSSPGTPDLRVNSSAVYNNLWQQENSFGVQYSFSPELYKGYSPVAYGAYKFTSAELAQLYKSGNDWNFYDQPLVANYSAFYRMPLGRPEAIEDVVASNPGSFGYDEATRKFNLPPPSGQPDLTVYASRATIDTSLTTLLSKTLFQTNGYYVHRQDVQQDLTVNNSLGSRLSIPLRPIGDLQQIVSGGLDFKDYNLTSYKINIYTLQNTINNLPGDTPPTYIIISTNDSPVPITTSEVEYLPLALRYDASGHDSLGAVSFGLGLSANLWYSGSYSTTNTISGLKAFQQISGSKESSGHWVVLNPSISQNFQVFSNWMATFRADGQWASEPLISNEQFGAGGINSVRGYKEGEAFGDTGWHVSLEQQTPPVVVGIVYGKTPLTIRGSFYTDYARTYLIEPQGRPKSIPLWGAGFGGIASVGSHWEARFLFSLPLLRDSSTEVYNPFFNFALTAQF